MSVGLQEPLSGPAPTKSGQFASIIGRLGALPERLRRPTSNAKFLAEIDGLRFVAILSVLFVHVGAYTLGRLRQAGATGMDGEWWASAYTHLERGVDLFFVISGFIIALPFVQAYRTGRPTPAFSDYLKRRLYRLEPPFVVAMTFTFAGLVLFHGVSFREQWPRFLATVTYLHGLIFGEKSTINFVTWSLEIEVQFYLLAPVIFTSMLVRSGFWRRTLFVVMGALSLFAFVRLRSDIPLMHGLLPAYLATFIGGVFLADLHFAGSLRQTRFGPAWDILGLAALAFGFAVDRNDGWGLFAMSVAFSVFVASAFKGAWLPKVLANRWVSVIGGMCYSIYLIHMPLIYLIGKATSRALIGGSFPLNFLLQSLLIIPPVLVLSGVFFRFVELPFMSMRGRRLVREKHP